MTALTVQETLEKTVQMQPRWVDAFKGFQGLNTALHTHGIRTLDTTPTSSRSRTARASLKCGVRDDGSVLGSVGTFANTWSSAEKSGIKNHRSTSCAIFHDSSIESFGRTFEAWHDCRVRELQHSRCRSAHNWPCHRRSVALT